MALGASTPDERVRRLVEAPRLVQSDALDDRARGEIRALLDAAFAGDFSDDDWAHSLGGTHALVETDGAVVAHASVVPRVLELGTQRVRAGYVEAVAVLPARQGKGLGTAVMRAHRRGHRARVRAGRALER